MKKYKKVYVEITNVCNLACDFCPETKRKPEYVSKAAFEEILDQIKPFTDYIYLHVMGEPLLHPKLENLLDISCEKGFKVNLTTNGTLIAAAAEMLIKKTAVRQINFSLHSFDGNQANIVKEEYIDKILNFSNKAAAESNIIISLRLWNLDEAMLTEDQRKRNVDILHKIEKNFNLSYKIQGNLSEAKALKLRNQVYLNQDYEFKWPDLKEEEDMKSGSCFGLRNQVAILVDGTVVPCCLDGEGIINLGNIHEKPFSDIIHAKRAEDIKFGFCNKHVVEELCRKCGYRKRFNK
ncbi:radical SAM/SPASM domain-containing protein [Pelosinus propionicus]|uniref:Radical SAM additional 4Fe4S-binding SPASM domain-containing protein n=1 Tax=Pelosinus propionicus DSM 13327 TaxID=1123291 RepID=A0A1I4IZ07_9FIRM|nr:radical SAM/SPASM domain-containing protein [Pelosinus propionicus]SFL59237.1 radical SAM additional 4Fe4S-binding SPASM domain-containing protein [Pelosinus propionicus DSM 13327]